MIIINVKEVRIMEQKREYKQLEIEVIDYEYEDVITTSPTSSTTLPER